MNDSDLCHLCESVASVSSVAGRCLLEWSVCGARDARVNEYNVITMTRSFSCAPSVYINFSVTTAVWCLKASTRWATTSARQQKRTKCAGEIDGEAQGITCTCRVPSP